MSLSVTDALSAARAGTLDVAQCLAILRSSEDRGSNHNPTAPGHPLQHSAQPSPASRGFRSLKESYHFRGGILPSGKLRMTVVAPAVRTTHGDGTVTDRPDTTAAVVTERSGAFHSQFTDDEQAATLLLHALRSRGGVHALAGLANDPTDSVTLAFGVAAGTRFLERRSSLNAVRTTWGASASQPGSLELKSAGTPTTAELDSTDNFVLLTWKVIGSVVAVLRADGVGASARLHVQTCYPSVDSIPPGASEATFVKQPALSQHFLAP